jgi:predicted transcriptional regulator
MNHLHFDTLMKKYQTYKPTLELSKALKLTDKQEETYIACLFLEKHGEPIRSKALSELLDLDASAVNLRLKGIVDAGLIKRGEKKTNNTYVYELID